MTVKTLLTSFFCALFVLCLCAQAEALRLTGKSEAPSPERISNPRPLSGDIVLPMPGGLSMVLRAICLPATGFLDDAQLTFGVVSPEGEDTPSAAWADRQYKASLMAPFALKDIPAIWGSGVVSELQADPASAAQSEGGLQTFLYFIGKYEVTQGQWRAVMETPISFVPMPGDDRPITNISWFEAIDFTRRYSEWLMKNHPEYLPVFQLEKRSSFIRLPTETEWEYAARGGHKVSAVERERTRLHPVPDNANMSDYIIAAQYDNKLSNLSSIGTRKPNPIGLFDILGNCAEMVQTPFQLVGPGHLIGNQGGFVIKGGSWRAFSEASLHPGRRIEAAYYIDGAAQRRDDLGFRISLGTILMPKDRYDSMAQEWSLMSAPKTAKAGKQEDVRVLIREVVREVESPTLRRRLVEAEAVASRYHAQVNLSEEQMMHEMLLGAAFSLETLANYAARCFQLIRLMDVYATLSPSEKAQKAEKIEKMTVEIDGFIKGMQGALFYYRSMLSTAVDMDRRRLLQQLEKIRVQFAHNDGFSRSMGRRITVLHKHLDKPLQGYTEWQYLQDILPDWLLQRIQIYWKKV
ncbi:MAG: SUMF1/EgtB/PvdO family nonheme iron enzyme [Desulfovibrionaceae bacterium]|nr:SUMF1/EgtB/PvdO family nonheme iron enzyme [Desulfovibrionaceae bacterium]